MNDLYEEVMNTDDVLEMLRQAASKLLLVYEETFEIDYLNAFEKAADACEVLFRNKKTILQTTIH